MNHKEIPQTLYKYRSWDNKFHRRLLTHSEIFFSSVDRFNDPFEGTIPIIYTEDVLIKKATKHIKEMYPSLKPKEARRKAKQRLIKAGTSKNPKKQKEIQYGIKKKRFGICTLSEIADNIPMWSHYADHHKGICVGFDTKKIVKYFELNFKKVGTIDLYPIDYVREYPELIPDEPDKYNYVLKSVIVKSIDWKYEREWRLISIGKDHTNFTLNVPDDVICKIILGYRIAEEHKENIIKVLNSKNRKIPLYQASIMDTAFGLDFKEIEY
ncbi:MAG: DUF2971 domain-containing protein [Candidatus Dadabacteria bacterium]|nr:DUF2971 domain-containing protein [Candidatus Dadabacteria bacterium]